MKSTFKVLFYLKKGSEKKNGEVMIMARITIDGKLCQFSTKQSIQPDNWNTAAGKAKGRDAGRINALLDDIRSSLNTIYHEMQRRDNYVTAEKVKNEFLGHSESHETILSLFQKHNDDVKQLVGISKTIATYRKYEVTRRHLAEFIRSKYNVSDRLPRCSLPILSCICVQPASVATTPPPSSCSSSSASSSLPATTAYWWVTRSPATKSGWRKWTGVI